MVMSGGVNYMIWIVLVLLIFDFNFISFADIPIGMRDQDILFCIPKLYDGWFPSMTGTVYNLGLYRFLESLLSCSSWLQLVAGQLLQDILLSCLNQLHESISSMVSFFASLAFWPFIAFLPILFSFVFNSLFHTLFNILCFFCLKALYFPLVLGLLDF